MGDISGFMGDICWIRIEKKVEIQWWWGDINRTSSLIRWGYFSYFPERLGPKRPFLFWKQQGFAVYFLLIQSFATHGFLSNKRMTPFATGTSQESILWFRTNFCCGMIYLMWKIGYDIVITHLPPSNQPRFVGVFACNLGDLIIRCYQI